MPPVFNQTFDTNWCDLSCTGPTLLLTSDIIKQRLGAAALDRYTLWQRVKYLNIWSFLLWSIFWGCFHSLWLIKFSSSMLYWHNRKMDLLCAASQAMQPVINGLFFFSSSSVSMSTVCPAGWANRRTSIGLFFTRRTTHWPPGRSGASVRPTASSSWD